MNTPNPNGHGPLNGDIMISVQKVLPRSRAMTYRCICKIIENAVEAKYEKTPIVPAV